MAKTPPAREDIIVVHVDFAARIHLRSVIPEIYSCWINISTKVWQYASIMCTTTVHFNNNVAHQMCYQHWTLAIPTITWISLQRHSPDFPLVGRHQCPIFLIEVPWFWRQQMGFGPAEPPTLPVSFTNPKKSRICIATMKSVPGWRQIQIWCWQLICGKIWAIIIRKILISQKNHV